MSPTKEHAHRRILDQILERYKRYAGSESEKILRAYDFAMKAHGLHAACHRGTIYNPSTGGRCDPA